MSTKSDSPARVTRPEPEQLTLLDVPLEWQRYLWGMPSYAMGDARPVQQITINFASWDDVVEFGRRLELPVSRKTNSLWFPPDTAARPSDWSYDDES